MTWTPFFAGPIRNRRICKVHFDAPSFVVIGQALDFIFLPDLLLPLKASTQEQCHHPHHSVLLISPQ
jgi:hypothetical protein